MCWVPGGEFTMGSAEFYPEEQPVHREHLQILRRGDVGLQIAFFVETLFHQVG